MEMDSDMHDTGGQLESGGAYRCEGVLVSGITVAVSRLNIIGWGSYREPHCLLTTDAEQVPDYLPPFAHLVPPTARFRLLSRRHPYLEQ